MMSIVKICIHHGELNENQCKKVIEKRWGIQPNYKYKCLECIKSYNQTYLHKDDKQHQIRIQILRKAQKQKHAEKLLEGKRRRQKLNRKKLNSQAKELRAKNINKHRERDKSLQKKWRETLDDNYVKTQFKKKFGLKAKDVPQWMVEIKREVIKLRRKIREIKECQK